MSPSAVFAEAPLSEERIAEPAACLLCGGAMRPRFKVPGDWRRHRDESAWIVEECDACRFGQLHPRPTSEELVAAYAVDDYYTHAAPQAVGAAGRLFDRLRTRLAWTFDRGVEAEIEAVSLARHGVPRGASVCDIGCGNGGLLRRLAAAGYDVVGIEPDADACRTARAAGLSVYGGSGESLPEELRGTRFDAVAMTHVLEHCLDPAATVANAAGFLRAGGLLFVETPNNACRGARRAGIAWRWLDVPRHLNFFTAESLRAVCGQADLEIAAVEFTGYTRQFRGDWIAEEREIARRLTGRDAGIARAELAALRLWLTTFAATPAAKYDSVRVIARKH